MKDLYILIIYIFISAPLLLPAQILSGKVVDAKSTPLEGARLQFSGSTIGTFTDQKGEFFIQRHPVQDTLVVSYVGYQTDTLVLPKEMNTILLMLTEGVELDAVTVQSVRKSHSFSLLNPLNVETLSSKEFRKAACCSLAESFQTSNTVDLSYNNAVVGNREIQFLGLRGAYTQQLIENRPVFTGILSTFGYDMIPGTWLRQVNIQKGAASSLYGAQSMTGAINIGLVTPREDPPLFVNAYGDYHGRYEGNIHLNHAWNPNLHSGLYLHGSRHSGFRDHNKDGFYDDSRTTRYNGLWRNIFQYEKWEGQFNIQALSDRRTGGQLTKENPYLSEQEIGHFNASANLGFLGLSSPGTTLGSIWDFSASDLKGSYGRFYSLNAREWHVQAQIILTHEWADGAHKIDLGPAITYNQGQENLKLFNNSIQMDYVQSAPALFADYQWKFGQTCSEGAPKFILSLSQRIEWPDTTQPLWIPRINMRYNLVDEWTLRASAGRGYRFYRLFSDQINYLSTNRPWEIGPLPKFESSWNFGLNIVGKPYLFGKELEINLDAYLTDFENQIIVDLDDASMVSVYNLEGRSRALVLGSTGTMALGHGFSAKVGGRYQNNKIEYRKGFRDQIMIPKWRALVSLDWESASKVWTINLTANLIGPMRLTDKEGVPHQYVHEHVGRSPEYGLLQGQVNYLKGDWEIYLGCENINNYTQHNAIIAFQEPHGSFFNATEVFAPINGIKPYIGIKYRLNKD